MTMLLFLKPIWPPGVEYQLERPAVKKKRRRVFKVEGDKYNTRAVKPDYMWMAKTAVETKRRKLRQQREDEEMLHVLNII